MIISQGTSFTHMRRYFIVATAFVFCCAAKYSDILQSPFMLFCYQYIIVVVTAIIIIIVVVVVVVVVVIIIIVIIIIIIRS